MTFTLYGRLQTRLFLVGTIGVIWTAIVTPILPSPPMTGYGGIGMAQMIMTKDSFVILPYSRLGLDYQITFETIGLVAVLGLFWELIYHFLQQFRWDKDWPPMFTLLAAIPEGLLLWLVINLIGVEHGSLALDSSGFAMFAIHFASTWVLMWLFMVGPLHAISLHWRFEGGEFYERKHSGSTSAL